MRASVNGAVMVFYITHRQTTVSICKQLYLSNPLYHGPPKYYVLLFRWHNTPLSEALRHRKTDVIEYMKKFSEERNNLKQDGNPYKINFKKSVTTI